ncbi:MAG: TetR/AcrR family transcriptional regulator [Lentisphaeria bacterium]|nr:TetR/AcrR family transcriptional regulator [Lentisphaeria bacterium]
MKKVAKGKGQRPGIRFNVNGIETRKNILHTAAMLFSSQGYAGTSFRDITKASKIGLGSLIYHFGVKENLFNATVSYFFPTAERFLELVSPLEACNADSSAEEIVTAIKEMVAGYLKEIHCNRKASFMNRLFVRLMIEGTTESAKIASERLEPARDRMTEFAKRVNPELTEVQALAWRRCLLGQIQFTMISSKKVLSEFDVRNFAPDTINTIAENIATTCYPLLNRK